MDHHRKTRVVSGYSTLKAAQRAAELERAKKKKGHAPKEGEQPSDGSPPKPGEPPAAKSHIGRTVMPTRLEVVCYACGYAFTVTGRTPNTYCPKCRSTVDLSDHSIESTWTGSLKTGGSIHVRTEGVVISGDLVATDIQLEGHHRGGSLKASRALKIGPGARFVEHRLEARLLHILPGADVAFATFPVVEHILIEGRLEGSLDTDILIEIRPGGCFAGSLSTPHLIVEEGGGLMGSISIGDTELLQGDDSILELKQSA